jgi:hypothetical protein
VISFYYLSVVIVFFVFYATKLQNVRRVIDPSEITVRLPVVFQLCNALLYWIEFVYDRIYISIVTVIFYQNIINIGEIPVAARTKHGSAAAR